MTPRMTGEYIIRGYGMEDAGAIRECVIALQEFERAIDPRLPPGEAMADAYCERLHARCSEADGRIFVAAENERVLGFVAVVAREPFTEPDDPPGTYALVTDLVVLEPHRGLGLGKRLLAKARGVRERRRRTRAAHRFARAQRHGAPPLCRSGLRAAHRDPREAVGMRRGLRRTTGPAPAVRPAATAAEPARSE